MNRRALLVSTLGLAAFPESAWARFGKVWALVVGVDSYSVSSITPLKGAINDAEAVGDALSGTLGASVVRVTRRAGKAPLRSVLLKETVRLASQAQDGDLVFVFFAGHGCEIGGKTYLLAEDADNETADLLRTTGLLQEDFEGPFQRRKGLRVVFAYDMCRVAVGRDGNNAVTAQMQRGAFDFSQATKTGAKQPTDESAGALVRWWSCSPDERSFETSRGGLVRGYFSWYLEKGIRGEGDAPGDLAALSGWVRGKVQSEVRTRENQSQRPRLLAEIGSASELSSLALGRGGSGGGGEIVNLTAMLVVVGAPPGARLTVNDTPVSGLRYEEDLTQSPSKSVRVLVEAAGYKPMLRENVVLARGKTVTVSMPLVKVVGAPVNRPGLEPVPPPSAGYRKLPSTHPAPLTLAEYRSQLVPIPEGSFKRGSGKYDKEKNWGIVTLSAFQMGRVPVTVGMWQEFCRATGRKMPAMPEYVVWKSGWDSVRTHPMVKVSWDDCREYYAWANKQSGVALSLPTEAQWEYAARGGLKGNEYPWGDRLEDAKCWYWKTSKNKGTASVSRASNVFVNGYGLVDMSGNVWQWCADWYEDYPERDETNPTGPTIGKDRVQRGGSWYENYESQFRCAWRSRYTPATRGYGFGFRLCTTTIL